MRGVAGAVCLALLGWQTAGCGPAPGPGSARPRPAGSTVAAETAPADGAGARRYRLEPTGQDGRPPRGEFVAWSPGDSDGLDASRLAAESPDGAGSAAYGAPFPGGGAVALGADPVDAQGYLLGSAIGDAYATGGLGSLGAGSGGGEGAGAGLGAGSDPAYDGYGAAGGGRTGRAPDLRLGETTVYGGVSREVVRRVVQRSRAKLRVCYEAALRGAPETSGRVAVRFTVGPDGRVASARVTGNSTGDEALGRCVLSVVGGMAFPASGSTIEVVYPFLFQPEGEELVVVARDADAVSVAPPVEPPPPPPPSPPPPTQGTLRAKNPAGEWIGEFPLEHTEVSAEISGFVARTEVAQRYANPYAEPIEAVYVFPLPALGAVHDFVMEIGERKIVGVVRERAEAERIYAEARAQGLTASLLSEERPNIFTQSVANIEPGGRV
ncbi:MAG: TonB family protein, partial [Myxococcales bacterium]|nr:TonB family protein [Myxococcales bacterium]